MKKAARPPMLFRGDTQAQQRIQNHLQSLLYKKDFMDTVLKLRKTFYIPENGLPHAPFFPTDKKPRPLELLKRMGYFSTVGWIGEKDERLQRRLGAAANALCKKQGLDPVLCGYSIRSFILFDTFMFQFDLAHPEKQASLVVIYDKDKEPKLDANLFPVVIRVSPHASRNDIREYIEKQFRHLIKPIQDRYKEKSKDIGGKRKIDPGLESLRKFLQKNLGNMPTRGLLASVKVNFPDYAHLGIEDLHSIMSRANKRK
jgi:hypothetical protein